MTATIARGFSRRGADTMTEELILALSGSDSFEFKPLFEIVHTHLRARKSASGGEDMLRLRAYDKLQCLVGQGAVRKSGKKYKGVKAALAALKTHAISVAA